MRTEKIGLSLKAAYAFGQEKGLGNEIDQIRNMTIEWDLSYTSSLRRGYIVELFEKHGIFEDFKARHWTQGNTPEGEAKRRRYLRIKTQYEEFLAGREPEEPLEEDTDEFDTQQRFAAESDLRDFLAANLECIEQGLRLHSTGDRSGIEFPIENGFIDILAVDHNERFVVIELKLSRGRNKALGQILYYMGWVNKNLGKGPCRGMIIAKEISNDLVLAVQRISDIGIYRYKLNVTVEAVA